MVSPPPVAKSMLTTLAEWYLTDARHHGEGAGPSLSDSQEDYWGIWAWIPALFSIFCWAKPLPGAPVGPFIEKTPVYWVQMNGLELSN